MTRIALVRGHHLSKEETVSYEPLKDQYAFSCVSTNYPWFDHGDLSFPVQYLPSIESMFRWLPGGLDRRVFGKLDVLLGTGQYMPGLKGALRGFDIVHCSDPCHLFTYQAARLKRRLQYKLTAIQYENIPFAREEKPLVRWTRPVIYREIDAFFAMSCRAKEALLREGVPTSKIAVIGNGVDTNTFKLDPAARREWRRRLGLDDSTLVVLFVGRLHESKGVFQLVNAAHRVFSLGDEASHVRFVLAGRGRAESALRHHIRRLGLEDRVLLAGSVPHADIHRLHSTADIFVLPSIPTHLWQEQFGIVLIESMACGIPVVAAGSGSIPEVVGDAGLLVQTADHVSLADSLLELIRDDERRRALGAAARRRVEHHFSLPTIGQKLQSAFESVLHGLPFSSELNSL